jgi:tetratricopeptide (TPR) repeat protein/two-component sensor histidine kinase
MQLVYFMKIYRVILLFVISFSAVSQKQNLDSLWKVWNSNQHDTDRLKAVQYIYFNAQSNVPFDSAYSIIKLQYELATKTGNKKYESAGLHFIGKLFATKKGDYDKAMEYYQKALKIRELNKDIHGMAGSHSGIGDIYYWKGDHKKAIENYKTGYKFYGKTGDKSRAAWMLLSIANVYYSEGNYNQALDFYNQSLKTHREAGNKSDAAAALNGVANVYYFQGLYAKAIENYFNCLKIYEESGMERETAMSLNNVATVYQMQNELNKAAEFYLRSFQIYRRIEEKEGEVMSLGNLGTVYLLQKNHTKALEYFKESLKIAESVNNKSFSAQCLNNIGDAYAGLKQYEKAEDYYLKALKISEENGFKNMVAATLTNIGEIYDTKKKFEKAIEFIQKGFRISHEAGMTDISMRASKDLYRLYKKTGYSDKALIMHEFYVQKHDSLKSDENLKEVARQETKYNFEKQKALDEKEHEKQLAVLKAQKEKQKVISYATGSTLALILTIMLLFVYRLRLKRKQEKILEDKRLSEYKLMALRAQMNPHFIFNSLNAIQYYISENDQKLAFDCMNKFSRLVRLVLESSGESSVTLSEEIRILSLYIELESMRFENKFENNIVIDNSIDDKKIKIPSFIIQPYVENAIVHGLLSKKNKGRVDIHIKKHDDNHLLCVIEDNGIGRNSAMELKKKKEMQYRSLGMKITESRLGIVSVYDENLRIIDLVDEENKALGTKVELVIPYYEIK